MTDRTDRDAPSTDGEPTGPSRPQAGGRDGRLAEALRANLARRKVQARARRASSVASAGGAGPESTDGE